MKPLQIAALLLASWAGSLGIAFGVQEWRDSDSPEAFCHVVLSVDGNVFLLADLVEFSRYSYEDLTPSQTARHIVRGHPIADEFDC